MGDRTSERVIAGRYRLVAEIGSGGMGRVWEGRDEQLHRLVALKEVGVPQASAAERETMVARALREGRTAAALADHPNVVPVYDVVIEDGVPWIVMQLVRGRSLRDVLEDGPLGPQQVGRIAEAMLSALGAADAAGVVHRDVKPGNIMLADDGRVLLTDFGIAKHTADTGLTSTGLFVGTMEYTAPERVEGHVGGLGSDLFSLGATLYQAAEGTSPFHRDTTTGTLNAVLIQPLPPFRRTTDATIRTLIEGLTRKRPADRLDITRARALLAGIGPGGVPTLHDQPVPTVFPGQTTLPAPRRRALMVASAVGAVALVVGGVVAITAAVGDSGTVSTAQQGSTSPSTTSPAGKPSTTSPASRPPSTSPLTSPADLSAPSPPPPPGAIVNTSSGLCIDCTAYVQQLHELTSSAQSYNNHCLLQIFIQDFAM